MAQYKVPQNVESEDKLLGPLTMKQFIYAVIGIGWAFLIWRILLPGGISAYPFMFLLIFPVTGFMLLLAFGRREEQSFENYLIALIRFTVMPRKRVWMKDMQLGEAIIDAPPPPKPTDPTAQDIQQVHSRLQQLALVVDTRGHYKPTDVQQPDPTNTAAQFSQRVFTPQNLQQQFIANELQTQDDVLAPTEGKRAEEVGVLLQNVEQDIRNQARTSMETAIQNQPTREPITPGDSQPQNTQTLAPPQVNDAIMKKVMDTTDLTVAQVAQVANRGQLAPGQSISFR